MFKWRKYLYGPYSYAVYRILSELQEVSEYIEGSAIVKVTKSENEGRTVKCVELVKKDVKISIGEKYESVVRGFWRSTGMLMWII